MSLRQFIPFEDILFSSLIRNYTGSPRFIERPWLADEIRLAVEERKKHLILITGEPGTGKSAFLAGLLDKNPDWLRYFIRRDQQTLLFSGSQSRRSFLLQIGFQLAGFFPDLFSQESIILGLEQDIGTIDAAADVTGVRIKRLVASPFTRTTIKISQKIREQRGNFTGLVIDEYDADPAQIDINDLETLAFYRPCRSLKTDHPEKKIVICIDALDELRYQESAEDNLIVWLSRIPIPDNVVFIVTSRPDDDLRSLWKRNKKAEFTEILLNTDNPLVIGDLHRFALKLVRQGSIYGYLQRKTIPEPDYIRAIVKKSDGNIGYLDAIGRAVDEIPDVPALDQILDLTNLPPTIQDLYAFFLLRLKESFRHEWTNVYLPILGVLCVAREPLTQDQIYRFGAMDSTTSTMMGAMEKLRQFLDYHETECTYRLYHATLPEFLTHDNTKNDRDLRGLYIDPREWHEKIAQSYGRMKDHQWDVKKLHSALFRGGPKKRDRPDTYGLFHLVDHLTCGGQSDDLHSLLAAEETDDHTRKNFWFSLKESENLVWSYREDIERAWKQVDQNKDMPVSVSLPLQIRYALIESSICSHADCIPPQLVRALVTSGVWDAEKALHHIRQISDHQHRAGSLTAIAPFIPPSLIERSYGCIQEIKYDLEKIDPFLALLGATGDTAWKNRIASEILNLLRAAEYDRTRSVSLNRAGPILPVESIGDACRMAMSIPFEDLRAHALEGLIPVVPEEELYRIRDVLIPPAPEKISLKTFPAIIRYSRRLPAAQRQTILENILVSMQRGDFADPSDVPELFSIFAGEAPDSFLPLLADMIQTIRNPMAKASAVAVLLPLCAADDRTKLLPVGMTAVDQIRIAGTQPYKVQCRVAFLPSLMPDEQQSVFRVALSEAQDTGISQVPELAIALLLPFAPEDLKKTLIADTFRKMIESPRLCRSDVIASISPFLDASQKEILLGKILQQTQEKDRVDALCSMAESLSGELMVRAIRAGYDIAEPELRYRLIGAISPHIPVGSMGEALAVVNEIRDPDEEGIVMCAFAEHISLENYPFPFHQVTDTLALMKNPLRRISALHRVAKRLPGTEQSSAWTAIIATLKTYSPYENEFYTALSRVAPDIPKHELDSVIRIVDSMADATGNEYFRRRGLLALLPKLPPPFKNAAIEGIFDVSILSSRSQILVNSLPYIPESDHVGLFNRILADLEGEPASECTAVITILVPVLPQDMIVQVLEKTALKITKPHYRALALTALIPSLPAEKKDPLVAMIMTDPSILEDWEIQAGLLVALAKQGNPEPGLVDRARVTAGSITDPGLRARAHLLLLPLLGTPDQKEIAGEVLLLCDEITSVPDRIQILLQMGSLVGFDRTMMERFWTFYRQLRYYKDRPVALLGVMPFLVSDNDRCTCLGQSIMQGAQWVVDRDPFRGAHDRKVSWESFFTVTATLPVESCQTAWQAGLHALADRSRPDLLLDLAYFAPFLTVIGGQSALSASLQEIKRVCGVWK